jgi:hypothetical protein
LQELINNFFVKFYFLTLHYNMARPNVALAAYVPGSANKRGAAPIVGVRGSLVQLINIRANSNKTK